MSWSFSVPPTAAGDFADALNAAAQSQIDAIVGYDSMTRAEQQATFEQIHAAVAATKSIAASGSIGPPSHRFSATLTGHANPGHGPREGWANDIVTISVCQVAEAGA
jgi:hypothetical protein